MRFTDDHSEAWIESSLIAQLQVGGGNPVKRTQHKRGWYQFFSAPLSFRGGITAHAKRSLKAHLELGMLGATMHWHQLELTDGQSRADFVRGTVNVRLIRHTRGSVLRGLDVGVSYMSLGETARIEVRPDYGFGEVYGARKLPPYSSLVFTAQVMGIGKRSAEALLLRRGIWAAILASWSRITSFVARVGSSLAAFVRSLGRGGSSRRVLRRRNETSLEELREGVLPRVEDGDPEAEETPPPQDSGHSPGSVVVDPSS